jgi:hypothetical protein
METWPSRNWIWSSAETSRPARRATSQRQRFSAVEYKSPPPLRNGVYSLIVTADWEVRKRDIAGSHLAIPSINVHISGEGNPIAEVVVQTDLWPRVYRHDSIIKRKDLSNRTVLAQPLHSRLSALVHCEAAPVADESR